MCREEGGKNEKEEGKSSLEKNFPFISMQG